MIRIFYIEGIPLKVIAEKMGKDISTINRHFKIIRGKFEKYKVFNNFDLMITNISFRIRLANDLITDIIFFSDFIQNINLLLKIRPQKSSLACNC